MMKPPMSAFSPVPTRSRVEMLRSLLGGVAVGLGEGPDVGAGVAVAVSVGVGVAVGVGDAGAAIVRLSCADPVPAEFAAEIVTLKVPDSLGVPEISPVAVLTERPAGKPEAPKLVGLLVAVIC